MKLVKQHIDFLSVVKSAAFTNPFSPERDLLDMEIAGVEGFKTRDELLGAVVERIDRIVARYDRRKRMGIKDFEPQHEDLIRSAILFYFFHRYLNRLDDFIVDQEARGVETIAVSWADELIGEMCERGFSRNDAEWYLGSFYQLRRAFFFIRKEIIGECQSICQLRMRLWNNVFTHSTDTYARFLWDRLEDYSTLLLGETGTGKSRAARAIGRSGFIPFDPKTGHFKESFVRAFVSINLSQFPETLIESELFGHKKGAFTGAVANQAGILHNCSPYGAIFLDEIAEISIPTQIKLLQVLQDRLYFSVGSREPQTFKGRVIAATNQNLDEQLASGEFRQDFYYRLCSDVITIPSLGQRIREDKGELKRLAEIILRRLVGSGAQELIENIVKTIVNSLGWDYAWTGNVRELEQCIRSILISGKYESIAPERTTNASWFDKFLAGDFSAEQLLGIYCRTQYEKLRSYEKVATKLEMDRRTVKKYVDIARQS